VRDVSIVVHWGQAPSLRLFWSSDSSSCSAVAAAPSVARRCRQVSQRVSRVCDVFRRQSLSV